MPSSKEDDDDGVRIILERSVEAVVVLMFVIDVDVGGSLDLKILYPTPAGLGKITGRGRKATLAKYGEKLVF